MRKENLGSRNSRTLLQAGPSVSKKFTAAVLLCSWSEIRVEVKSGFRLLRRESNFPTSHQSAPLNPTPGLYRSMDLPVRLISSPTSLIPTNKTPQIDQRCSRPPGAHSHHRALPALPIRPPPRRALPRRQPPPPRLLRLPLGHSPRPQERRAPPLLRLRHHQRRLPRQPRKSQPKPRLQLGLPSQDKREPGLE